MNYLEGEVGLNPCLRDWVRWVGSGGVSLRYLPLSTFARDDFPTPVAPRITIRGLGNLSSFGSFRP